MQAFFCLMPGKRLLAVGEGLLRSRPRLPVSSAVATPLARRTRASMEHGHRLNGPEAARSSGLGQEAEGEIRNLDGPDGPNGFRDRTKSPNLQGCYVQFASGRLGGPVLLAAQRSRGRHNVWATQLANAHGGAAAGRVAPWVGDADADAVRTRWCEPAD